MKIFGIPVKIDPSFLFVCALLAYSRLSHPAFLVEWLIVIFVSILIHELGHALMVRSFGLSPQIMLYSMGGLTSWREEKSISHAKHIAISLAGPFAGFYLAEWFTCRTSLCRTCLPIGSEVRLIKTCCSSIWGGEFSTCPYCRSMAETWPTALNSG